MKNIIVMPKPGQLVNSCVITHWHKHEGDIINAGDIIFSYETDKSCFDEDAKIHGRILSILAKEGEDVPCLSDVCVIECIL